jgi:RNA 3'-terminal phosphate cyclase (ATP)
MVDIDGAQGEGGGQVLRTALGLSLVTGTPFRIVRIRGGRAKPGLLRQHLTCVHAAAALGSAEVEGDVLGSGTLTFRPRALQGGVHHFSIGTAGSTTLVLQAVLSAMLRAREPTTLTIEGGTHNGLSPPFDFLAHSFLPLLRRLGAQVEVRLTKYGFEPAGGGALEVTVRPATLSPLELVTRGALVSRHAKAVVSSVPLQVAQRELAVARETVGYTEAEVTVEEVRASGPGNALVLTHAYAHVTEVFVGLGARGLTAEKVARRTCGEVKRALRTDAPVGMHLADQLLIPLALAGGGTFRTVEPTLHTRTQLELIPRFLGVRLACEPEGGGTFRVTVR